MIRLAFTEILLFLVPFAVYAVWIAIARRTGRAEGPVGVARLATLVVAGLLLMAAGFAVLATFGDEKAGHYRPAEFRDGVLVPGRFE